MLRAFKRVPFAPFPFLLADHFMKLGGRPFDIEMLILAGAAFGGNNCATVNVQEIAVRKLVSPLGVFILLAVYLKTPFCERGKTVLTNESLRWTVDVCCKRLFRPR